MGVLDRFRNKPVSFLLERKVGRHYETATSFSTGDYPKGPPTKEELEEEMEDGVAYRLQAIFKDGNKKQVWRRGGQAAKSGEQITDQDVKTYFQGALKPLETLGDTMASIRESLEKIAGVFYGGGRSEEGEAQPRRLSVKEELIQMAQEYEAMRSAARSLLGTSLGGGEGEGGIMGIPPPAFEGKFPWYMNPWMPKVMQYWSETAEAMAKSVTKGIKEALVGEEKEAEKEEKVEVTLPSIELPPPPAEKPVAPPAIELPEVPEAAPEERVVELEKPKKKRSKKNE